MFCPYCNAFVMKSQLIKANVKTHMDVEIEYNAHCPHCDGNIGRMFWGRLELAPGAAMLAPNSRRAEAGPGGKGSDDWAAIRLAPDDA